MDSDDDGRRRAAGPVVCRTLVEGWGLDGVGAPRRGAAVTRRNNVNVLLSPSCQGGGHD